MNVLLLAPQPFYQERGTPIAVDLMARVLSERGERVDIATYHEGADVEYPNVTINRIPNIPFVRNIPPGFTWKKLVCDFFLLFKAIWMAFRGRYQLVHAVEEAALIALLLKLLFRIPYVYDMDSSFAQQMVEKYPRLRAIQPFFDLLERLAVRNAKAVVPVCDALAEGIQRYGPGRVTVLHDVSLLNGHDSNGHEDLKTALGIRGPLLMYVGNLEGYQGIDLLLESFALALQRKSADLAIIGGKPYDVEKFRRKAGQLGIEKRVHFVGPRPVAHLSAYLAQADVLVSPRIKGQNTPMKLYSYLHSGKAVLATDLPTHTQVLDSNVALLAPPDQQAFSESICRLLEDEKLRERLGSAASDLIERRHTYYVFRDKLNDLYDWLSHEVAAATSPA
ncbi:MAG: glycosyltransferase family 4 protein [Chloroflexi bacterium]|nr:glycosyltransferase family 4 protein [Chloroflexota bacterium]